VSRGTAQRLMTRGHRSTGGAAIRAEPGVTIWRSFGQVSALTTIERPTGGARVALSVMANAPKITSGFVGKEKVGTEIYLLRGPFETPANPGKKGKIYVGVTPSHVGRRAPAAGSLFRFSLVNHANCSERHHRPVWNHRPRRRSGDVRLYQPSSLQ
jgi:hypothetical protein